jgi:glycosyltransferase involved in cell wall biosynthesis
VIATVRPESLLARTLAEFDFGRAIPPLRPDALADVVHEFARDPGLRRRLGDNARRFATGFDRQEIAKGFAARVRAIAEERSSRMPRVPPP